MGRARHCGVARPPRRRGSCLERRRSHGDRAGGVLALLHFVHGGGLRMTAYGRSPCPSRWERSADDDPDARSLERDGVRCRGRPAVLAQRPHHPVARAAAGPSAATSCRAAPPRRRARWPRSGRTGRSSPARVGRSSPPGSRGRRGLQGRRSRCSSCSSPREPPTSSASAVTNVEGRPGDGDARRRPARRGERGLASRRGDVRYTGGRPSAAPWSPTRAGTPSTKGAKAGFREASGSGPRRRRS